MHYNDVVGIFFVCKYLAFGVWGFLFFQICWFVYRKNYDRLKRTILYALNTIVFLFVWAYSIDLAMIVQAPIKDTWESSVTALRESASEHFQEQLLISLIVVCVLTVFNLFYARYVLKKTKHVTIVMLCVADSTVLIAGSLLACALFVTGLMSEINGHFADKETMQNLQSDSTIRVHQVKDTFELK